MALAKEGKYTFLVRDDATKTEISKIIRKLYNVEVAKVNVINAWKKFRMSGRRRALVCKRHAHRKAIVSLKGKKTIDIYKIKSSK